MTRILRLLLIAAVALPIWQPAAAHEKVNEVSRRNLQPSLMKSPMHSLKLDKKIVNSIQEVAPQAAQETVGMQLQDEPRMPMAGMRSYAPSLKAGGNQIYDYYEDLLLPNSQVNQTNYYLNLPIRGASLNTRDEGQMIYNSSLFSDLQNGDIIYAISFYASTDITPIGENETNSITLRVGNTTTSSYTNRQIANQMATLRSSLSSVYTGALPIQSNSLYFEFSEPITYTGNNLVVDLVRNSGDYAPTIYWYSTLDQSNYVSAYNYGTNGASRSTTLPAMRVYYKRAHTGTAETRTIAVKDSTFFKNIEYQWTNSEGTHTSNLDEIATDPDQMIAMIREVYTNKSVPGNLKRGFATNGSNSGQTNQDVYYSGVGGIDLTGQYVDVTDSYVYNDIYGWNIPGNVNEVQQSPLLASLSGGWFSDPRYTYAYYATLDQQQYRPNEEGLTLLLVEMKENYVDGSNDAIATDQSYTSEYDRLKAYFQNTVKSVRVINEAKRMGEGLEAGTLFKIDCDKMNKFFLLAKGQLNLDHNSPDWVTGLAANGYISGTVQNNNIDFCVPPGYLYFYYSTSTYNPNFNSIGGIFSDTNAGELFYHMFEQFSPVANNATAGMEDVYQSLINMDSFGVKHDCIGITQMNHQFMMYGPDSKDADCQDVRDMMFFIPDYRMLEHTSRGSSTQQYHNYHPDLQPTMGLYVIRQNEITPTKQEEEYYMLNLNWVTNIDQFLPSEDQEFELLQVVIDEETGIEKYVSVYYMNENGQYTDAAGIVVTTPVPIVLHLGPGAEKNYPDVYVARQTSSQQVTYAIRGRDTGHFLSLQISNRQSYIIPGTDPQELVSLIELSHYSRYNPQLQENCYSNRFKLSNNVGGLTRNNMSSAQANQNVFTFTRKTSATDANPVTIATATVTARSQNGGTITVVMQNQAEMTEFPKAKSGNGYAGYHANPSDGTTWTVNFTYGAGDYVNFGDFVICDNFVVDVSSNAHPSQYIYEVNFNILPTTEHNFDLAHGSAFRVPIYKTASTINNAYTLINVKSDMDHSNVIEDINFGERVQYSSKTEILRNDVYRWTANEYRYIIDEVGENDAEQDLPPHGIAGNQGEGYTVTMNDVNGAYYYNGGTLPVSSGTAWAQFVDYYPKAVAKSEAQGEAYIYAPVVETFSVGKNVVGAKRTDYNTYGGPQQLTAVGVIDIDDPVYQISDYSWLKGNDRYAYYTVELPIKTDAVPAGYKIYMIRAWRVVDPSLLDEPMEAFADRKSGDYMFEEMLGKTEEGITEFLPQGGDGEYQPGTHMRLGAAQVAAQNVSGEDIAGVYRGTFGARKVRTATGYNDGTIEDLNMNFRVRLYFTPEVSAKGAAPKAADSDKIYYIAEYTTPFTIKGGITTGLESLNARQVVGVKYYNVAGIESDTPFQGVNIMVTRYSDGSSTTTKILK